MQTGLGWRHERITEESREWEYRDSSGYSVPHTGNALQVIYNLKSSNHINSNHVEFYAQDTYRTESKAGILSVNYGARLSHWDWNPEPVWALYRQATTHSLSVWQRVSTTSDPSSRNFATR